MDSYIVSNKNLIILMFAIEVTNRNILRAVLGVLKIKIFGQFRVFRVSGGVGNLDRAKFRHQLSAFELDKQKSLQSTLPVMYTAIYKIYV